MRFPKFISIFLVVFLVSLASQAAVDMQQLLDAKKSFWKLSENELSEVLRIGQAPSSVRPGDMWSPKRDAFAWTSNARHKITGMKNVSSFGSVISYETNVSLKDGKAVKVDMSLYNRADAGELGKTEFEALLKKIQKHLAKYENPKHKPKVRKKKIKSAELHSISFHTAVNDYKLTWSKSPFKKLQTVRSNSKEKYRYEYIKLQVSKYDPNAKKVSRIRASAVKKNIVRKKNGEVMISNVPMVDQGEKGYCSVATMSRIMKYYKIDADQHLIAQLCESSSEGGTDTYLMIRRLKKAAPKLGLKLTVFLLNQSKVFDKIIKNYNKISKRRKKNYIRPYNLLGGREAYYKTLLTDTPNWIKAAKKQSNYKKFKSSIKKAVDAGKPVAWGVFLGVMPENPVLPQSWGGHLRLIIGYNFHKKVKAGESEGDVLYSDSWGAGHELKRMPVENAWTITSTLCTLMPR